MLLFPDKSCTCFHFLLDPTVLDPQRIGADPTRGGAPSLSCPVPQRPNLTQPGRITCKPNRQWKARNIGRNSIRPDQVRPAKSRTSCSSTEIDPCIDPVPGDNSVRITVNNKQAYMQACAYAVQRF